MKQPIKRVNSLQLKDKRSQITKQANEIIELAKKEVRDLTDDEAQKIEDYENQVKEVDEELKALQSRLENLRFGEDNEDEDEDNETPSENNEETKNLERSMKKKRFSLLKAIRSVANNQKFDEFTEAIINKGQEEARKAGINTEGQIVLPDSRSAVTVASEGEDVVATDLFDILMPLRAKNVLVQAGAKFMGGLTNNVQIPVMTANNVTWKGEIENAADGAGTFSHVTLTPHRLTAYVDISKQMLAQDSVDVENAIRTDLINAINTKLEETILGNGDGKEGGSAVVAPVGMRNGVTAETVSDFETLCEVESDVEDANVLGECVYVMSNKAKAALRGMIKGTNGTGMVYENGTVDGTKALSTSHMGSAKTYIYGDFSNLAICSWGNVDVTVDTVTQAIAGKVRIVVNAFFDAKKLRNNAFAVGTIAAASSN